MNDLYLLAAKIIQLIIAVSFHEVAHGYVAYREGDPTAKLSGRLTLNPLKHLDPFLSIIFPLSLFVLGSPVVFGAAKPVPVNPYAFKRGRRSEVRVAAAGILTNLGLALSNAICLRFFPGLGVFFETGIIINTVLFVFNALPVPPLDGSRIIYVFMPYSIKKLFIELEKYSFLLIFVLLYFFGDLIFGLVYPLVKIFYLIAYF
jgi:Zn-dependent protease